VSRAREGAPARRPGTTGTLVTKWKDRVEHGAEACDDEGVPLSEDEQRILRQIEQELEQDPTFSQRGYRVSRRRSAMLVLGLLVGLALTIGGLAVNFLVAFAGFVLVLVMAVMLESELRLLGRERLGQLPISAWLNGRRERDRSD
jgi:hypothetical protein